MGYGNRWTQRVFLALILLLAIIVPTFGYSQATRSDDCLTQWYFDLRHPNYYGSRDCPQEGVCDQPEHRDLWLPDSTYPIQTVRVLFHVFADDNCSNPVINMASIEEASDSLNSHYAPWRLEFDCQVAVHCDSRFTELPGFTEIMQMQARYAARTESQLNIYVSYISHLGGYSMGTFPWDYSALREGGGILQNSYQLPPYNMSTLTHEVGHCLGLWHTFHGVSEVPECGACYESPFELNRDVTGDFCSDTDPTPLNTSCGSPSGNDPCTDIPWGNTQPQNFMGYAPPVCRTEFTGQQAARIHCWTRANLLSWLHSAEIIPDVAVGQGPLEVNFSAISDKTILDWSWDFGDGDSSAVSDPSHTYELGGEYDVALRILADPDGELLRLEPGLIWVQAETLLVGSTASPPEVSVRVDLYGRNTIPLTEAVIPFHWGEEIDLTFDSARTIGLRTETCAYQQLASFYPAGRRAAFVLRPSEDHPLSPDTGALVSLFFTAPAGSTHGDSASIWIESYGQWEFSFTTARGSATPHAMAGDVVVCLRGDVNADGDGPDISDLIYLVAYMFQQGPVPSVLASADIDGSSDGPDIADLIYLVNFMFQFGPPPPC